MWIERTKNNKFQYRERYLDPITRRYKNVSVVFDDNKRSTQKLAQKYLDDKIDKACRIRNTSITLRRIADYYIEYQRSHMKEQTALGTAAKLRTIMDKLGDIYPKDLNAWYVQNKLSAKPCTYNERLKIFKAFIRWAYRNDFIEDISFLDKLQRMKDDPVRIKVQDKFLEHDEIDALLPNMVEHWRLLTELLLLTGMRIGEALDLKVKNVKGRELTIESTFSLTLQKSSSTKTESSARTIFIQDELLTTIENIAKYRARIDKKNKRHTIYLLPDEKGSRVHYDAYRKYLREASERYIGRPITPHIFRHTHTALLAENGIQLEQISRRLGHADSKTTKEVYMHVTERLKDIENERIKKLKLI